VREELPTFVEPMLLQSATIDTVDASAAAVEVKWDGIRALVAVDRRGRVSVRSRPGRQLHQFPELEDLAGALTSRQVLLDGELLVLDSDGKPNFSRVSARLRTYSEPAVARGRQRHPAHLVVWDLLHLDGVNTRPLPYTQRRELLAELALRAPGWQTPPALAAPVADAFAAVAQHGLEGIVVKPVDSAYVPGRRGGWTKVKALRVEPLPALRWVPASDQPSGVLVGRPTGDGGYRPLQVVRFGLSPERRRELRRALATQPIGDVVVEVAGHGRRGGVLRDAHLKGFRISSAGSSALRAG